MGRMGALQASGRRTWKQALLVLAGLLLSTAPLYGQQVRASVSADSVTVGERFFLSLAAEHDGTATPLFPPADSGKTTFGDLEVIAREDPAHATTGAGTRIDSVVYEVTTFALDTAFVPPVPVRFAAGADTLTVSSQPFYVPVISLVPPDAQGPKDLAPLAVFPVSLWPWIVLALALVLLAALAYVLYRRRQRAPVPAAAPPPEVSPYDEALERLRRLEPVNLDDSATVKPFYVELSDLLRTYLERRLGVPALEMTTRELQRALLPLAARRAFPEAELPRVRRVLDLSDLAKFADVKPAAAESRSALAETRQVLEGMERAQRPQPAPLPIAEPDAA